MRVSYSILTTEQEGRARSKKNCQGKVPKRNKSYTDVALARCVPSIRAEKIVCSPLCGAPSFKIAFPSENFPSSLISSQTARVIVRRQHQTFLSSCRACFIEHKICGALVFALPQKVMKSDEASLRKKPRQKIEKKSFLITEEHKQNLLKLQTIVACLNFQHASVSILHFADSSTRRLRARSVEVFESLQSLEMKGEKRAFNKITFTEALSSRAMQQHCSPSVLMKNF
jgi:hypothetical protein